MIQHTGGVDPCPGCTEMEKQQQTEREVLEVAAKKIARLEAKCKIAMVREINQLSSGTIAAIFNEGRLGFDRQTDYVTLDKIRDIWTDWVVEAQIAGRCFDNWQDAWLAWKDARAGVCRLAFCEIPHLILKEDVIYRFFKVPGCAECTNYEGTVGVLPSH